MYHVNGIKVKREIIWAGGLPHLPGVPHLYVNRSLDWQNINLPRAPRFFVHFFVDAARLRLEASNFTFYGGREQKMANIDKLKVLE